MRATFEGGSIAFPPGWKQVGDGDAERFVVRAPDDMLQATVSAFYFAVEHDKQKDLDTFRRMLEHRLRAEREASSADLVLSTPAYSDLSDGTMVATYKGTETNSRRFAAKLVMRDGTFIAVYLEAIGSGQRRFDEASATIFESLSVHHK